MIGSVSVLMYLVILFTIFCQFNYLNILCTTLATNVCSYNFCKLNLEPTIYVRNSHTPDFFQSLTLSSIELGYLFHEFIDLPQCLKAKSQNKLISQDVCFLNVAHMTVARSTSEKSRKVTLCT